MNSGSKTKAYEKKLKGAISKDRYQSEDGDHLAKEVQHKDSAIQTYIEESKNLLLRYNFSICIIKNYGL